MSSQGLKETAFYFCTVCGLMLYAEAFEGGFQAENSAPPTPPTCWHDQQPMQRMYIMVRTPPNVSGVIDDT